METLTLHAQIRLTERTSLSPYDIKGMIDSGRSCPVGIEKNKIHYLFYSIPDDDHFVIVRDEITKDIITVYPWHYNPNRCFYSITSELLNKAKSLVMNKPKTLIVTKVIVVPTKTDRERKLEAARQSADARKKQKERTARLIFRDGKWKLVHFDNGMVTA
jgi:hypothetical protein